MLAQFIARRFSLDHVSICLPDGNSWRVYAAGPVPVDLEPASLTDALAGAGRVARVRRARTHRTPDIDVVGADTAHPLRLVPLRIGDKAIGLLAAPVNGIEPGTVDALAGIVAIAIERVSLLGEREAAEISRHREELKSALLASLAHDLKTPLTAIRIAADNLQAEWLTEPQRREQGELVLSEVERLSRLFEGILDMARIDAGAVTTDSGLGESPRDWSKPRARWSTGPSRGIPSTLTIQSTTSVFLDPRLTSAAFARLLENAAAYSPPGTPVEITVATGADGLRLVVRDHGPGVKASEIPNLFHRFFRGSAGAGAPGTGMGLAIARGLLAAEGGRVWVENHPDGGAVFTISVDAPTRQPVAEAETPA